MLLLMAGVFFVAENYNYLALTEKYACHATPCIALLIEASMHNDNRTIKKNPRGNYIPLGLYLLR